MPSDMPSMCMVLQASAQLKRGSMLASQLHSRQLLPQHTHPLKQPQQQRPLPPAAQLPGMWAHLALQSPRCCARLLITLLLSVFLLGSTQTPHVLQPAQLQQQCRSLQLPQQQTSWGSSYSSSWGSWSGMLRCSRRVLLHT